MAEEVELHDARRWGAEGAPGRILRGKLFVIGDHIYYPSFSSSDSLTLIFAAQVADPVLRVTPSHWWETGAAWYKTRQSVADGFSTSFLFQIGEIGGVGADGLAFVIQDAGPAVVGSYGQGTGYQGITRSLAVELDTYSNPEIGDPNDNHISIHSAGIGANSADESYSLGRSTGIPNLSDGAIHQVDIDYFDNWIDIYIDSDEPCISVPINLEDLLGLQDGGAWVGFTSATGGGGWETHDVLAWRFGSSRDGSPSCAVPGTPIASSPACGDTTSAGTVSLVWTAASSATSYDYELFTNPDCSGAAAFTGNVPHTTYLWAGVPADVTYSWRVRARNNGDPPLCSPEGIGGWSSGCSFSTVSSTSGDDRWTQLSPVGGPPQARTGHLTVYDSHRNRMIVFGGSSNPSFLNDVWTLEPGPSPTWTLLNPAGSPPGPRAATAGIYDPVRDRLILYGGYD